MKTNELIGRKFKLGMLKKEIIDLDCIDSVFTFVITWNDENHVRATPLMDETGLLSYEFLIEDVIDILEEE